MTLASPLFLSTDPTDTSRRHDLFATLTTATGITIKGSEKILEFIKLSLDRAAYDKDDTEVESGGSCTQFFPLPAASATAGWVQCICLPKVFPRTLRALSLQANLRSLLPLQLQSLTFLHLMTAPPIGVATNKLSFHLF